MSGQEPARAVLQRVAVHVLGRRRQAVTGRFGLRVAPGGVATPAFGPEPEVLRTAGAVLVREVGASASCLPIDGSSLRELVAFAGDDVGRPFECGADTPPTGDVDAPLALDAASAFEVAAWFALGQSVLDEVVAGAGAGAEPATPQLWPEHFDVATHLALPDGGRVNVGASPGDGSIDEPYLYVGPWGSERPGDASYWDVPWGAALRASSLRGDPTADRAVALAWVRRGLELLAG